MRRGCAILFRVLQEDFSENVSEQRPPNPGHQKGWDYRGDQRNLTLLLQTGALGIKLRFLLQAPSWTQPDGPHPLRLGSAWAL